MKKIITILTLTIILTILLGCQTSNNNESSIPSAQAVEPVTKEVSTTPETTEPEPQVSSVSEDSKESSIETSASISTKIETTSTPQLKEFSMIAKQWEFSPNTITVNKGDTVRITIKSIDVSHGFHLPDFNINQQINPGKPVMVEFIADKQGTFPFSCSIPCGKGHGMMTGELIVQ